MRPRPTLRLSLRLSLLITALLTQLSQLAAATATAPEGWFEFRPTNENGPSVIGMESWLEAPAGARGPIRMEADKLVAADGTEMKFWGVNLGGSDCTPTNEMAVYWAERFARYGINAVRFHKPWDNLYSRDDSTRLDPEALARFDFFCNELRQRGIYYSWSFFYHRRLGETDLKRLRWPDDLTNPEGKRGNIYGVVEYMPEVQDILIEATENLLQHVNPDTGLRYADDPALMLVEFQNEASILFWSDAGLKSMPNYERDMARRFSQWLMDKYGSAEALQAAWGDKAFNIFHYKDESLEAENILVVVLNDFYSTDGFARFREEGTFQRHADTAEFLYHVQNAYYSRYAARVREAGFDGPLVGSCWRGKGDISEYYNLLTDANVGVIDRHNYFGGLGGWKPRAEPFNNKAQINNPGGGLFSSGMVQVADRPYAFSEWATVFPNEYVLESPAIIAAYGMGLQGWDASFQFATNTKAHGFSEAVHLNNLLWVIERPENMGIYPAVARMVLRKDIREGAVISTRRVAFSDLQEGRLPWGAEYYSGWRDVKTYVGPMPGTALAAGRVVVEFTDAPAPTDLPDMARYEQDGVIRANTGQLVWDVSRPDKGFFTINAPGTRAIVGFAPDQPQQLGEVSLAFGERGAAFAGVFLSSLNPELPIEATSSLLLTTMARARNAGMRFNEDRTELLELGEPPVYLEPVQVTVSFGDRTVREVHILDHDGRRTGRTLELPASAASFSVDGHATEAFYYEIVLQ